MADDRTIAELRAALAPFAAYHEAIVSMGGNYPKSGVLIGIETKATGPRELTVEHFAEAARLAPTIDRKDD